MIRLALVILASGVVLAGVAFGRHRARAAAARGPLRLDALDDVGARVVLFTDAGCRRCDTVRARLRSAGIDHREVSYDREPELQRSVGVGAVPLIVVRDADGHEVTRLVGLVSKRRIVAASRAAGA